MGCLKKNETSSTTSTSSTAVTEDLATRGFPIDLVLSSPTVGESTGTQSIKKGIKKYLKSAPSAEDTATMSYEEKVEVIQDVLEGESIADCDFNFSLNILSEDAECYGPAVQYQNHPDYTADPQGLLNGQLPIGDLGIWDETNGENSEACSAAQMNTRIQNISGQVDSMFLTMASLYCIANVNGIALPEEGESIDLTSEVISAYSENGVDLTVTSVTIQRESDTDDGDLVYVTTLTGTTTDIDTSDTRTLNLRLKHIPTSDDNSTYKGKISYTLSNESSSNLMWCDNSIDGSTDATSISYEKQSDSDLLYQLKSGQYCGYGEETDPYVSTTNFTVDPSKKAVQDGDPRGWASNFYYANFNMNPLNGTGDFQFAWQAGSPDSATRVLNLSLQQDDSDNVTGCAYFGYGPDSAANSGVGSITAMYCNWAGPNGAAFVGSDKTSKAVDKSQKQCIAKSPSDDVFTSTSANISYAPTLDCDHPGGAFAYGLVNEALDHNQSFSNDLVDISGIDDLTSPTAPIDVDVN